MRNSQLSNKLAETESGDIWKMISGKSRANFAIRMRRGLEKHGTTLEQVAKVSVKNHHNARLNHYAQFKREFSTQEIFNSRMISDPITLLMCCPRTDGQQLFCVLWIMIENMPLNL